MGISNPGGSSFTDILKWYDTTLVAPGRFDVTGIPQGYSCIRGILHSRSTVAAVFDFLYILLNGDTTAGNYRRGSHEGGASHVSSTADDPLFADVPAANSPANYFGSVEFSILLYAGAHEKIISSICSDRRDAAAIEAWQFTVAWENTAAINQITIQPDGYATDTFVTDSRLQLWLYK